MGTSLHVVRMSRPQELVPERVNTELSTSIITVPEKGSILVVPYEGEIGARGPMGPRRAQGAPLTRRDTPFMKARGVGCVPFFRGPTWGPKGVRSLFHDRFRVLTLETNTDGIKRIMCSEMGTCRRYNEVRCGSLLELTVVSKVCSNEQQNCGKVHVTLRFRGSRRIPFLRL